MLKDKGDNHLSFIVNDKIGTIVISFQYETVFGRYGQFIQFLHREINQFMINVCLPNLRVFFHNEANCIFGIGVWHYELVIISSFIK